MRTLLVIVLFFAVGLTVLCAAGYFAVEPQQYETRAELSRSQSTGRPITDGDIARQVSHIGLQRRNWGIAGILAAACSVGIVASLTLTKKR